MRASWSRMVNVLLKLKSKRVEEVMKIIDYVIQKKRIVKKISNNATILLDHLLFSY